MKHFLLLLVVVVLLAKAQLSPVIEFRVQAIGSTTKTTKLPFGLNSSILETRLPLSLHKQTYYQLALGIPSLAVVYISQFSQTSFFDISSSLSISLTSSSCGGGADLSLLSFGWSVDLTSEILIVGSPFEDSFHGSAYVFRKQSSNWLCEQRLTPPLSSATSSTSSSEISNDFDNDSQLLFGWDVKILSNNVNANKILISGRGDNITSASVFSYSYDKAESKWVITTLSTNLGFDISNDMLISIVSNYSSSEIIALTFVTPSETETCSRKEFNLVDEVWNFQDKIPIFNDDHSCPISISSSVNTSLIAAAFSDHIEIFSWNETKWYNITLDSLPKATKFCTIALSYPFLLIGTCNHSILLYYSAKSFSNSWKLIQTIENAFLNQLSFSFPLLISNFDSLLQNGSIIANAFAPICGDDEILPVFEDCEIHTLNCNTSNCKCLKGSYLNDAKDIFSCDFYCGNKKIDFLVGENCDDGNNLDNDGCNSSCLIEDGFWCQVIGLKCQQQQIGEPSNCSIVICGNGAISPGESCDDGNKLNGDGCSENCTIELGWTCKSQPSKCVICGNGTLELWEECDDGNLIDGDGCSSCLIDYSWFCNETSPSICYHSLCGDHKVTSGEECDDSKQPSNGDGCSINCTIERGWKCSTNKNSSSLYSPTVCEEVCGNGILTAHEQCDDENSLSGDGCSENCFIESPYVCYGEPSSCIIEICGDGIKTPMEKCDDNNTKSFDGCSSSCDIELGYSCLGSPSICKWISCDISIKYINSTNCSCHGAQDGTLFFVASGGTNPLTYAIKNIDIDNRTNDETLTFYNNANNFKNLIAGEYKLFARSADNCFVNITTFVQEPIGVSDIAYTIKDVSCYGTDFKDGQITFNATFKTSKLLYALSSEPFLSPLTNLTFSEIGFWDGLETGKYYVIVYNGLCDEHIGPYIISQPQQIVVNVTQVTNTSNCDKSDGNITFDIKGGVTPYIYFLNGVQFDSLDGMTINEGSYSLFVMDSHSCISLPVEFSLSDPEKCHRSFFEKLWNALGVVGVTIIVIVIALIIVASIVTAALCVRRKRLLRTKYAQNTILLENMSKYS